MGAVAAGLGLEPHEWVPMGDHRAKVRLSALPAAGGPGRSRYVLVTGMTPTQSGEGKTVTSVSLAMGLRHRGHRAVAALRQSSLGPTLGLKGGGAGGGRASVWPLDESIFGLGADLFAVESANNLLAARVDDEAARGVTVDPDAVSWRRVVDMNDRALRRITVRLDAGERHLTRATGFDITAASEVMAVLSLARDLADLRARLGAIVVGASPEGESVTAEALGAAGAMAALLRDALQPNLLQATDGTPVLVHGGPFANIAHGCSSVVADRIALDRADYVVTEAGFAADLGAEKFLHLKVPVLGRAPDAAVLVATARAVVEHGERLGVSGGAVAQAEAGVANVVQHVAMLRAFGLPVVVAVNRFPDDDPEVLAVIERAGAAAGATAVVAHTGFVDGGPGAADLADAVADACALPSTFAPLVDPSADVADKVAALAARVYGAAGVVWDEPALAELGRLRAQGFGSLPVCVAKTHRSLSHDPALAGVPSGYEFPVRGLRLRAGAGFVTVYAGDILTMPGLGARPRFLDIDVAPDGTITGLA